VDSSDAFYSESPGDDHFHRVISLHEEPIADWEALSKEIPVLPRGWFELSRLSSEDRIEFTKEYWFAKLPFLSSDAEELENRLRLFFDQLNDVGLFATQQTPQSPFEVHMVYSLAGHTVFFHGSPPATKESISVLTKQFANFTLPPDYLAFLEIHDGFCKYTDKGIIKMRELSKTYLRFQKVLEGEDVLGLEGEGVNPTRLIPFYESSHLFAYQCFYADWYPFDEMGNVYFSQMEDSLGHFFDEKRIKPSRAYTTFLEWLLAYLEEV